MAQKSPPNVTFTPAPLFSDFWSPHHSSICQSWKPFMLCLCQWRPIGRDWQIKPSATERPTDWCFRLRIALQCLESSEFIFQIIFPEYLKSHFSDYRLTWSSQEHSILVGRGPWHRGSSISRKRSKHWPASCISMIISFYVLKIVTKCVLRFIYGLGFVLVISCCITNTPKSSDLKFIIKHICGPSFFCLSYYYIAVKKHHGTLYKGT